MKLISNTDNNKTRTLTPIKTITITLKPNREPTAKRSQHTTRPTTTAHRAFDPKKHRIITMSRTDASRSKIGIMGQFSASAAAKISANKINGSCLLLPIGKERNAPRNGTGMWRASDMHWMCPVAVVCMFRSWRAIVSYPSSFDCACSDSSD